MISFNIIEKVLKEIRPDELINLSKDLVRINSVWDPVAGTSEKIVAEMVARWAKSQGFGVEVNQVAEGRDNVIITFKTGPGKRNLMFEGHTDVVTPGDVSDWEYDPFEGKIVGRRMYGRGTNDTKGNLAAMLIAMASLKRSGIEFLRADAQRLVGPFTRVHIAGSVILVAAVAFIWRGVRRQRARRALAPQR